MRSWVACRGTLHQLLNTSFRKVLFGIHMTRVTPRRTSFDGYNAISVRDIMTSSHAVWRSDSPDWWRQFLKSKSLLISDVGFWFWKDAWSQPLKHLDAPNCWLSRVLIGRLGSFRAHFYIKGWLDPSFSFSRMPSLSSPKTQNFQALPFSNFLPFVSRFRWLSINVQDAIPGWNT